MEKVALSEFALVKLAQEILDINATLLPHIAFWIGDQPGQYFLKSEVLLMIINNELGQWLGSTNIRLGK